MNNIDLKKFLTNGTYRTLTDRITIMQSMGMNVNISAKSLKSAWSEITLDNKYVCTVLRDDCTKEE